MAAWSLDLIGVPIQYRSRSPYALSADQRVDSFPERGNPKHLEYWTQIMSDSEPEIAATDWQELIQEFVWHCESHGDVAFFHDSNARNTNEHVRAFLQERRRRVVSWIDAANFLKRSIFKSGHKFVRLPNSFIVRSHVHFRPIADGLAVGTYLRQHHKFARTVVDFTHGNVWHRWLEFGTTRILWSAQGNTDAQLYYEIHCPYTPEFQTVDHRNWSDKQFHDYVDSHIWKPLTKTQRYWSSSNPRIIHF